MSNAKHGNLYNFFKVLQSVSVSGQADILSYCLTVEQFENMIAPYKEMLAEAGFYYLGCYGTSNLINIRGIGAATGVARFDGNRNPVKTSTSVAGTWNTANGKNHNHVLLQSYYTRSGISCPSFECDYFQGGFFASRTEDGEDIPFLAGDKYLVKPAYEYNPKPGSRAHFFQTAHQVAAAHYKSTGTPKMDSPYYTYNVMLSNYFISSADNSEGIQNEWDNTRQWVYDAVCDNLNAAGGETHELLFVGALSRVEAYIRKNKEGKLYAFKQVGINMPAFCLFARVAPKRTQSESANNQSLLAHAFRAYAWDGTLEGIRKMPSAAEALNDVKVISTETAEMLEATYMDNSKIAKVEDVIQVQEELKIMVNYDAILANLTPENQTPLAAALKGILLSMKLNNVEGLRKAKQVIEFCKENNVPIEAEVLHKAVVKNALGERSVQKGYVAMTLEQMTTVVPAPKLASEPIQAPKPTSEPIPTQETTPELDSSSAIINASIEASIAKAEAEHKGAATKLAALLVEKLPKWNQISSEEQDEVITITLMRASKPSLWLRVAEALVNKALAAKALDKETKDAAQAKIEKKEEGLGVMTQTFTVETVTTESDNSKVELDEDGNPFTTDKFDFSSLGPITPNPDYTA